MASLDASASPSPAVPDERPQDTMPLPLASLGVNPDLKLTEEQLSLMASLGDEFIAMTTSSSLGDETHTKNQERASKLWQAAQLINDERFRALFGDDIFNAQQIYRAQVEQDQAAHPVHAGL